MYHLFSTSALIGMHSIYIWQLVHHVAAPFVLHMCDYTGGVATISIYPYPAVIVTLFGMTTSKASNNAFRI